MTRRRAVDLAVTIGLGVLLGATVLLAPNRDTPTGVEWGTPPHVITVSAP